MRTQHHLLHLIAHQEFFETIDAYALNESYYVEPTKAYLPPHWRSVRSGVWYYYEPPAALLPAQGWKIHVSATTHNAVQVLQACVPVFVRLDVPFKHAGDRILLSLMNSKLWNRGGSGKFLTVYPKNREQFLALLDELADVTNGLKGPYILSDRRYKDSGCVFYRYGTIRHQGVLQPNGGKMSVLVSPSGELIEELRGPTFILPSWEEDPTGFPEPASTNETTTAEVLLGDGRYRVLQALAFANSGGVYFARRKEDDVGVVIKEARPHTNWTSIDSDAPVLLRKEYRLLKATEHLGIAPKPYELFEEWENSYLVQEHITGLSIQRLAVRSSILLRTRYDEENVLAYKRTLRDVFVSLATSVQALHDLGIVFGDLSPTNVLWIESESRVRLIDFEAAIELGVDQSTRLNTIGFAAPRSQQPSFENDWYAVGAILLSFMMPINEFLTFEPSAASRLIDEFVSEAHLPVQIGTLIKSMFSLQPPPLADMLEVFEALPSSKTGSAVRPPTTEFTESELTGLRDEIVSYILANATPDRRDRLFPSDFRMFSTNPCGLSYGATGILYALHRSGTTVPETLIRWVSDRKFSAEEYPPGLTVGLAGIAWGLLELGLPEDAARVLNSGVGHRLLDESNDLALGLAGWGLTNLLFFHRLQDERYLRESRRIANLILERALLTVDGQLCWPQVDDVHFGLHHGASGIALFLLYMGLFDADESLISKARSAFQYDLAHAQKSEDDGLSWFYREKLTTITLPYWSYGSSGIGAVALRFRDLLDTQEFDEVLAGIRVDTDRNNAVFMGLNMGLAGMGTFHTDDMLFGDNSAARSAAHHLLRGITRFAVRRDSGLAFTGEYQGRISCDYGTGSAGILRLVSRLLGPNKSDLMFDSDLECRKTSI